MPLAGRGKPDEVGRTVEAPLAGELPYTVEQVVRVDGGASLRIMCRQRNSSAFKAALMFRVLLH